MTISDGTRKFKESVFPAMRDQFESLKAGQSPETLFITCSDSRIDPNLVTQTGPGELFVIRNAGNIVPRPGAGELGVEATIQYAVDVLKVKRIVVCGHSHCGAVTGLMNLDSLESMPLIRDWVKTSEKILERVGDGENRIMEAIEANAKLQLEHLREFDFVSAAIESRGLELDAWVYHFETGDITDLA